jgi:uncharacterized protein YwgA
MDQPIMVAALVSLNGGKIVGKTRLQKTVYLLKSCGVDLGFDFDYHHYGPYSEELSIASGDAVALQLVNEEWHSSYGNDYAVFSSSSPVPQAKLPLPRKTSTVLTVLAGYDAVTLELAATADFLSKNGFPNTAWEETRRRKASKVTPTRIQRSKELVAKLASL